MATTSNRAPLLVTLVIVLGVGGRWLRGGDEAPTDPPVASAALDSQLALVEQAGDRDLARQGGRETGRQGTRGRTRERKQGTAREDTPTPEPTSPRERGTARERATPRDRVPPRAKRGDAERSPRRSRDGSADSRPRRHGRPTPSGARSLDERDVASGEAPRHERTPLSVVQPEGVARLLADRRLESRRQDEGTLVASTKSGRPARSGDAGARSSERPTVDVESATAAELERLPRVGPALAQRIVSDRAVHGRFGSLEGLQRVRGIGPAMARQLQGYVTFGGTGRP